MGTQPDLHRDDDVRPRNRPDDTESRWPLAGFVLLVVTIELQVRAVEEPYLLATHGDAYRDYLASVGRFVPGVGRLANQP